MYTTFDLCWLPRPPRRWSPSNIRSKVQLFRFPTSTLSSLLTFTTLCHPPFPIPLTFSTHRDRTSSPPFTDTLQLVNCLPALYRHPQNHHSLTRPLPTPSKTLENHQLLPRLLLTPSNSSFSSVFTLQRCLHAAITTRILVIPLA